MRKCIDFSLDEKKPALRVANLRLKGRGSSRESGLVLSGFLGDYAAKPKKTTRPKHQLGSFWSTFTIAYWLFEGLM